MSRRVSQYASLGVLLTACVTINIYFPAAEAERAADQIIRDIVTEPKGPSVTPSGGAAPEGSTKAAEPGEGGLTFWSALIPSAQAASADLNIDAPDIRRLRASMKARFPLLRPFFETGAIGYSQDGLVAIRDLNEVPLRERPAMQRRVGAENRDRAALYQAIAAANGHPEWEEEIRATFAHRWVANAPAGWWFEGSGGKWQQK